MTQPGTIHSQAPLSDATPTLGQAHTRWTDEMDMVLNEVLAEEVALRGKKPNNNGLKAVSINKAADVVSERCKVVVNAENVRNRFKLMKRKYVWAREAINKSGLGIVWDGERKCMDVEESVWKEYCKDKPKVEPLRKMFFPLYDAMWTIFGDDSGARGDRAFSTIDLEETQNPPPESPIGATDEETVEAMEHRAERQAAKKKARKDPIVAALEAEAVSFDRVVVSLERLSSDISQSSAAASIAQSNTPASVAERLWSSLGSLEGLTEDQQLTANMLLTPNPHGFLATPDEHKKRAVAILLRHHNMD